VQNYLNLARKDEDCGNEGVPGMLKTRSEEAAETKLPFFDMEVSHT
jgi:hypothetical protein